VAAQRRLAKRPYGAHGCSAHGAIAPRVVAPVAVAAVAEAAVAADDDAVGAVGVRAAAWPARAEREGGAQRDNAARAQGPPVPSAETRSGGRRREGATRWRGRGGREGREQKR